MVLSFEAGALGVLATAVLAGAAVAGRALTWAAGAVAAAFGCVIVVLAGYPYLGLLVLFVAVSAAATRYRFAEKQARHVQEGSGGERGISNVVAHIVIPTGLAIALAAGAGPAPTLAALYASALAFGASDTFASEFGVLAGRARSLLTLRPVTPGTNGGVSARGEAFALAGAAFTAAVAAPLFVVFHAPIGPPVTFVLVVAVAGFLGCQIDSALGELLENRGWLTKGSTNLLGMLGAVGVALLLLRLAGAFR